MEQKNWRKLLASMVSLIFMSAFMLGPACPDDNDDDDNGGGGGSYTIDMSGGNGANGTGGDADYIELYTYGKKGVQFGVNRNINASFSLPAEPAPEFGDTVVIIKTNTVVDVYVNAAAAAGLADGELYMVLGDSQLYIRDSVSGDAAASGLKVEKGKTLTLGLNYNWYGQTGQDGCYLGFDHDVVIAGTVTVKDLTTGDVGAATIETGAVDRDKGWLDLASWNARLFVTGTGKVDIAGENATTAGDRGGNGGSVFLYGYEGLFVHGPVDASGGNGMGAGDGGLGAAYDGAADGIYLEDYYGYLVNTGRINASGGKGQNGGDAGCIDLYGDYSNFVYNRGNLIANGGDGTNGNGGDADYIELYSYYGSLFNSGKIEGNGGNGGNGDGGNGANIYLDACNYNQLMARLVNSAAIEVNGGDGENGNGGDGGYIEMYNYGSGDIIHKGPIHSAGGDGGNGNGGEGGDIYFYNYYGYDYGWIEYAQAGDVIFGGGNIDISGGDGSINGGAGGYLYGYSEESDSSGDYPDNGIFFVGYDTVKGRGGDGGNGNGGSGAYVYIWTYDSYWADTYVPAGPIVWKADFLSGGGDAVNGVGGYGGYIEMYPDSDGYADWTKTTLIGNMTMNGGNGELGGGDGGQIHLYGYQKTTVKGDIEMNGGDATSGNNNGGGSGYFDVWATYDIVLGGSMKANGGDASGTGTGGYGIDDFYIYAGGQVESSMSVQAKGGDSPGGTGGDGGDIDIFSQSAHSVFNKQMNVNGGDGVTDGSLGWIYIDWTLWNGYH